MIFLLLLLLSTHATFVSTKQKIIEKYKALENIEHCSPEVTFMDYSHNLLTTLTNDTFSECFSLQTLKLSYNKIQSIEIGSFCNLKELTYLVLSHNQIDHLDGNIIEKNGKLETLILSNNPLLVVPQLTSGSLKNLVCNFCKRIEVKEDTFVGTPNVESVSLVGTEITPFDVKGLTNLRSLQVFIINNKGFKRCFPRHEYPTLVVLQQSNVTLGPDVFCKEDGCLRTDLSLVCKHMYLQSIVPPRTNVIMAEYSYNAISAIRNESFVSPNKIRILRLDHNVIKHIDSDAFRALTDLQYIDLSHNELETIQESLFTENKNLLTVDLSHNSIIVPPLRSNSLETLVCDFCKLIQVEEYAFLKTSNLKSLRLLGTEVVPFEESAAKTLPDLREFVVTRNDVKRCFPEEDYPGLLYLQNRNVALGDDVFCNRVNETITRSTSRPPDITNSSYRNEQFSFPLFFTFILFILQHKII